MQNIWQLIIDSSPSMFAYWDREQVNVFASNAFEAWFHVEPNHLQGRHINTLLSADMYERARPHIAAALRGEAQLFERSIPQPDGSVRHALVRYQPFVQDGEVTGFLVEVTDVSMLKQVEESLREANAELAEANAKLRALANMDGLTGIPNRRFFTDALNEEIEKCLRYAQPLAMILLDIDHFKNLNDSLGHQAGDQILKRIGEILVTECRSIDIAARYGGEEFALLLPHINLEGGLTAAERLRQAIESYPWDDIPVTASFGVAGFRPGIDTERLIAEADSALYLSKERGRNRVSHAGGEFQRAS